jgi:hypothetical protein
MQLKGNNASAAMTTAALDTSHYLCVSIIKIGHKIWLSGIRDLAQQYHRTKLMLMKLSSSATACCCVVFR